MIAKKTVLDQVEITRSGIMQLRFALQLVEGDKVLSSSWHRTTIPPGLDPEAQIAVVSAHLVAMGQEPVGAACLDKIKAHAAVAHTAEVVKTFRAEIGRVPILFPNTVETNSQR